MTRNRISHPLSQQARSYSRCDRGLHQLPGLRQPISEHLHLHGAARRETGQAKACLGKTQVCRTLCRDLDVHHHRLATGQSIADDFQPQRAALCGLALQGPGQFQEQGCPRLQHLEVQAPLANLQVHLVAFQGGQSREPCRGEFHKMISGYRQKERPGNHITRSHTLRGNEPTQKPGFTGVVVLTAKRRAGR